MTRRYLVFLLPLLLAPTPGLALNEGLGEPPPEVDRHTPAATVAGFLEAAHTRDTGLMPHYLWLSHLPKEQQRTEGERLARRLMFVVDRTLWFDFSRISQDAQGDRADALYDSLGQIPLGRGVRDIRLRKVNGPGAPPVWVFSEDTVRAIDALFAEHGSPVLEQGVQVTACGERTMTLRALVSAADAGKQWDLRCLVREKLVAFLQQQPRGLPVLRAEASLPPDAAVALGSQTLAVSSGTPGENVLVPGARVR